MELRMEKQTDRQTGRLIYIIDRWIYDRWMDTWMGGWIGR